MLDAIESIFPPSSLPASGAKPMSVQDREMFLTPGGLYTKADIAANGNTSVYQKYPNFVAAHDTSIETRAALCPISRTKPNPNLTWIIGGKTYTFCRPPCVAEFVAKAKRQPTTILPPDKYVQR